NRTGLRSAQQFPAPVHHFTDSIDGAVDHAHVHALPQAVLRNDADGPDDGSVVDLVDVLLVLEQTVQAGETSRHAVGSAPVLQEEVRGETDTGESHDDGHTGQAPLEGFSGCRGFFVVCGLRLPSCGEAWFKKLLN